MILWKSEKYVHSIFLIYIHMIVKLAVGGNHIIKNFYALSIFLQLFRRQKDGHSYKLISSNRSHITHAAAAIGKYIE